MVISSPLSELRVLTFNTWLLKPPFGYKAAEDLEERMQRIPAALASTDAHIMGLQEVWNGRYRDYLSRELAKYGYQAIEGKRASLFHLGDGLMCFTKLKVLSEPARMKFKGYTRTDEMVLPKGALHTSIEVPGLGALDFYNSHLGAITYNPDAGAFRKNEVAAKDAQIVQLAEWIRKTRSGAGMVLCTDLNTHPFELQQGKATEQRSRGYRVLTEKGFDEVELGLRDCWAALRPRNSLEGLTWKRPNPYVSGGLFKVTPDVCVDYILDQIPSNVRLESCEILFSERWPDPSGFYLSDHCAILASYRL